MEAGQGASHWTVFASRYDIILGRTIPETPSHKGMTETPPVATEGKPGSEATTVWQRTVLSLRKADVNIIRELVRKAQTWSW